jgi:hypothetical protein
MLYVAGIFVIAATAVLLVSYLFNTYVYIEFDDTGLTYSDILKLKAYEDPTKILFAMLDGYIKKQQPEIFRKGYDFDSLYRVCKALEKTYSRKFREKLGLSDYQIEVVIDEFLNKNANSHAYARPA